jgi:hypothetical protein
MKGIQVCSKEGDSPFPRGDNSERIKIHLRFKKKSSPDNQTWYKLSFDEENSSLFKCPLERGDNHRNVRKEWDHLKILFLRTMKPHKLNFT